MSLRGANDRDARRLGRATRPTAAGMLRFLKDPSIGRPRPVSASLNQQFQREMVVSPRRGSNDPTPRLRPSWDRLSGAHLRRGSRLVEASVTSDDGIVLYPGYLSRAVGAGAARDGFRNGTL